MKRRTERQETTANRKPAAKPRLAKLAPVLVKTDEPLRPRPFLVHALPLRSRKANNSLAEERMETPPTSDSAE